MLTNYICKDPISKESHREVLGVRTYEFWGDTIQPITRVSQNELKSSQEGAREPGAERDCQPRCPRSTKTQPCFWFSGGARASPAQTSSFAPTPVLQSSRQPRTVQLKAAEVAFSERTSQCPEHPDQEQGAWEHTSKLPTPHCGSGSRMAASLPTQEGEKGNHLLCCFSLTCL